MMAVYRRHGSNVVALVDVVKTVYFTHPEELYLSVRSIPDLGQISIQRFLLLVKPSATISHHLISVPGHACEPHFTTQKRSSQTG